MHSIPTRMGVTGTWPELPERVLSIICILLKLLHMFAWNHPIALALIFIIVYTS